MTSTLDRAIPRLPGLPPLWQSTKGLVAILTSKGIPHRENEDVVVSGCRHRICWHHRQGSTVESRFENVVEVVSDQQPSPLAPTGDTADRERCPLMAGLPRWTAGSRLVRHHESGACDPLGSKVGV